jgi:hypothetical protein
MERQLHADGHVVGDTPSPEGKQPYRRTPRHTENERRMTRGRWFQVSLALIALGLGTLVYMLDRPPGTTALPESITLFQPTVKFFGALGQSLPAFAHVFAFSLLTIALVGGGRGVTIGACTSWFLVDTAFELGQYPAIATRLAHFVPTWFETIPILNRTNHFFRYGTFDPLDLLSIALGALAAYVVAQRTQVRRAGHE